MGAYLFLLKQRTFSNSLNSQKKTSVMLVSELRGAKALDMKHVEVTTENGTFDADNGLKDLSTVHLLCKHVLVKPGTFRWFGKSSVFILQGTFRGFVVLKAYKWVGVTSPQLYSRAVGLVYLHQLLALSNGLGDELESSKQ